LNVEDLISITSILSSGNVNKVAVASNSKTNERLKAEKILDCDFTRSSVVEKADVSISNAQAFAPPPRYVFCLVNVWDDIELYYT